MTVIISYTRIGDELQMNYIDAKKLGENIKNLRKFYRESQEDLAKSVGETRAAVCNYEKGVRIPKRDILFNIANHYKISIDELISCNFQSDKNIRNIGINDASVIKNTIETLFPVICSDTALKNAEFKKAHMLHTKLIDDLQNRNFELYGFDECISLYKKSADNGCLESSANFIWWNFLILLLCSFINGKVLNNMDFFNCHNLNIDNRIKNDILPASDDEQTEEEQEFIQSINEYINENKVDICVNVYKLKNSKEYSDLGDYYLAWCYKVGVLGEPYSLEMRNAIGDSMLSAFSIMQNKYAKKF